MFKKLLTSIALCLALTSLSFGAAGTAGPVAGGTSYNTFVASFAQPSVSWPATTLVLTYSAGSLLAPNATTAVTIATGTLTLTGSSTNYVYWDQSSTSLAGTTTLATALAATPLYACTATTVITGCQPYSATLAPRVATYTSCGTSASCASPAKFAPNIVKFEQVAFSSSTTLALTGIPAGAFAGTTTYDCYVQDTAHPTYTFGTANQSATATTITASTSNSDSVNVTCIGH